MIDSTDAYKILKEQIQESIDFVILCCHAVPSLKTYIKLVDSGCFPKIPDPDLFVSPVQHDRLKDISTMYRKNLGKFLVLSSFSYFESYVSDVIEELLKFHGNDQFLALATEKRNEAIALSNTDNEIERIVKKLREKAKSGKSEKYTKLNSELSSTRYRFPSELFSVFGIKHFKSIIENMRAYQIPGIVQDALGLSLNNDEIANFDRIRDLRNKIAHGDIKGVNLKAAIDDNKFLRDLAIKIDKHIVKHFFVIET